MNLAEFPIALLTDRAPEGQKTVRYEDRHGKLTITGSDAYGLPTAGDADVIVALIQLTKLRNNFTDPVVNFTRYELLKLLNWQDVGKSYRRLSESLNRWATVSLRYQGTWWNNRTKRNASVTMHILESVVLYDRMEGSGQSLLPLSSFTWNKTFLESCQANNLKSLDLGRYFSFQHPSSKRLYRFLDKRLYANPDQSFSLDEIAFERVGLSRNYAGNAGKIKEKLQPAINELEAVGFLEPMSREDRYRKEDRTWIIRFVRKQEAPVLPFVAAPANDTEPEPPALAIELANRGVTKATAAELVQRHPAEFLQLKMDVFDWLLEKQDKRVAKSPAGYLVKSINDDYAAPKGFIPKAERQRQQEARQAKERQAAEDRRRQQEQDAREKAERQAIDAYWQSLTPEQQAEIDAASLAQADPATLAMETGPLKRMGQMIRRHTYIRQLLASREQIAAGE